MSGGIGLWLVGCGNMGGAMLRRWSGQGAIDPRQTVVIDPGSPEVPAGVRVAADAAAAGRHPGTIVLAVKPQQLAAAADTIRPSLQGHPALLISILAGVTVATLGDRFAGATVVRAMPNLPVGIGQGVVALHGPPDRSARAVAAGLMAPLGLVEWIDDEALFDAVTALSGCGPGFVFRFIDALAEAGAALGLPDDQARRLAVATVAGTGLMAAASPDSPATLADRVASPGGSTREGLNVLDADDALKRLLRATLAASARRNAEMAAAAADVEREA